MLERSNDLGDIRFSKNVITRIAEDAAEYCENNVSIFNYRGKYKPAMPGANIIYTETPDGIEITVNVVIRFGASISECARKMLDYMYKAIESVMGTRPEKITIVVTGIQSREIARRHIEITE